MSAKVAQHVTLAVAVLLAAAGSTVSADDWPQWRGPRRNGVAENAVIPAEWPKIAPTPRWRIEVGEGESSPVVSDGRLFVMGRSDDGRENCYAIRSDNGEFIWKHSYDAPYTPADASAGKGPKSTPTVDGEHVYMFGVGGLLHCFDTTNGSVIWRHDCQREFWGIERDSAGDDAWSTCCGAAASPLVDGDRLILPVGGKKAGAITAFDKKDGRILWSSLDDRSSYASPIAVSIGGERQIIAFTGLRMVGIRPSNGTMLWDFPFRAEFEQTMVTPAVWRDLVFVGGERRPITALRIMPGQSSSKIDVAWENNDLRSYLSTPIVVGDYLYGHSTFRNLLVCIDVRNGETMWKERGFGKHASLMAVGNRLLVLTDEGRFVVAETIANRFISHADWSLPDCNTMSHPCIVGNCLYLKCHTELICLELTSATN
jgi:outer membrane protein assembly factor BamB